MSDQNDNELLVDTQSQFDDASGQDDIESLRHRLNTVVEEKKSLEIEFGQKRAKFKDYMLKKEDEMRIEKETMNSRIQELVNHLEQLQKELDESKSLLVVSQFEKENELDFYRQRHNDEMGSMRSVFNEKFESFKNHYDQEVVQLKKVISEYDSSLALKSTTNSSKNGESMLSVVTKSLKQKVGSLNTSGLLNVSLDEKPSQTSTSSSAPIVKSQQFKFTKDQDEEINLQVPLEETKMLKEKLRNMDKKLNSYEKMFMVLMREFGFEKICELIKESSNSKETNEQVTKFVDGFLKEKQLNTSIQLDIKESILAYLLCEQNKLRNENEKLIEQINQSMNSNNHRNLTTANISNITNRLSNKTEINLKRSQSQIILSDYDRNKYENSAKFSKTPAATITSIEHFKGERLSNELHSSNRSNSEEHDIYRSNRPCEMCSNYEHQLQTLQLNESEFEKKLENNERLLNASKKELIREQEFRMQMEEKYVEEAKECEKTIEKLQTKLSTANYEISQLKCSLNDKCKVLNEKLEQLKQMNSQLEYNLTSLENENARLLGRFVSRSKELQREAIDLPQTLEDVQFYCLKIREDLISVSIAKEKLEEDFKSQMMLFKEQQKSEHMSEQRLQDSLTIENQKLHTQLSQALRVLDNLKSAHDDQEHLIRQTSGSIQTYEKQINELQSLNSELTTAKTQFENENTDLKCKLQNLQSELETSEAVQKDFVKLSQSLQIELEKIRQADSEVRWQHEDDVPDCNNCKKKFNSKKVKIHCNHCGKVFCCDCCSKTILGGPYKARKFKVCQVCHTLLDQTTAPYFSSQVNSNV